MNASTGREARILRSRGPGLGEAGITLIEILIAVTVLAVVVAGSALGMGSALTLTRNNRNRTIAANLASREMDTVRTTDFDLLQAGRTDVEETVDSVNYTVHRDLEWIERDAADSSCDGPVGQRPVFIRVSVSVEWPNMAGVRPVSSETILAPPVGAYDPTAGHISVKVLDRDAVPASGHLVTITGPSGSASQTTANGCAFFAYIAPGAYAVLLTTPGYVDGQGVAAISQSTTVQRATTSSVQFDYDQAAALELGLGADSGYPAPANVAVTASNPRLSLGTKVFSGTGSPRTMTGLFPYADGYSMWTGNCLDADPEGERTDGTGPFYPGDPPSQRDPALPATPGGVTAGTVRMKSLDVQVTNGTGTPVPLASVQAVHAPDSVCTSGSTLDLGATDPVGRLTAAMPFGSWTFKVVGRTPAGAWPVSVLDPTQPDPASVQVTVN